jgi:hypothetical protein
LNIVITDDLDAVAPWVAEVEKAAAYCCNASICKRATCRFFVVDDLPRMASVICGLPTPFL